MQKTKKKRVAVVHAEVLPIPPVLGGAVGQIVHETVEGMPEIDWTVISRWDDALQDTEEDGRFWYVDIDARVAMVKKAFGGRQKVLGTEAELRRFCYVDGVADLLQDSKHDVVQVENRPEFVPYLQKRLPQSTFVLFLYNDADFSDVRVLRALDLCTRVVFSSHDLAARYCKHDPKLHLKAEVIYNSINSHKKQWHPQLQKHEKTKALFRQYGLQKGKTLLFVGRGVPEKGLHCLLDAMPLVLDVLPDVRLVVVSSLLFGAKEEGVYLRGLKKRVQRLEDRVIFTGYVNRDRLSYYYALADVLVVPSLFNDSFPTVILEASASGVPVIGSQNGGIPEMVQHGKTGMLVDDPQNAEELADVILKILVQDHLRKRLGKNARKWMQKHFTDDVRWQRLLRMYHNQLNTL